MSILGVFQNIPIFNIFIRGRREGVKANKTNVLIYSLFLDGFPNGMNKEIQLVPDFFHRNLFTLMQAVCLVS